MTISDLITIGDYNNNNLHNTVEIYYYDEDEPDDTRYTLIDYFPLDKLENKKWSLEDIIICCIQIHLISDNLWVSNPKCDDIPNIDIFRKETGLDSRGHYLYSGSEIFENFDIKYFDDNGNEQDIIINYEPLIIKAKLSLPNKVI